MFIEIIATDVSNFNETGFGGIESCYNFYKAIKDKYSHTKFNIIEEMRDLEKIVERKPDVVVFGFKYIDFPNKRIWLSEYFAENNINFIGSPKESIIYDSNKVKAKEKIMKYGINTAPYFVTSPTEMVSENDISLNFPLFIKPLDAACSFGVDSKSLVHSYQDLKNKVNEIYECFNQPSLVENFLPGREFTVVVIGNDDDLSIMPVEIGEFQEGIDPFLSREVKLANVENPREVKDSNLKKEIISMAKKIFYCLDARDFARIDIKLDANEIPHFLEINLLPGFTKGRSYFPIACQQNNNLTYDQTILNVFETSIKRLNLK